MVLFGSGTLKSRGGVVVKEQAVYSSCSEVQNLWVFEKLEFSPTYRRISKN